MAELRRGPLDSPSGWPPRGAVPRAATLARHGKDPLLREAGSTSTMTLHSMTGFGSARIDADLPDGTVLAVGVEIRSVNHKHLQVKVRLPSDCSALESGLEKRVRAALGRGSVQVSIEAVRSGADAAFQVDQELAGRYLRLQRELAAAYPDFGLTEIQTTTELLGLPGVVTSRRESTTVDASGPEAKAIEGAVDQAVAALLDMRRIEGEAMGADLLASGAEIARLVGEIAEVMPGVSQGHRDKLLERVRELTGDAQISEADLAREVALIADRLDVAEELARLASHLDQLFATLKKGGAVGRQLDFLAQEFFREANTIGSKGSDATVAHLVVDLKTQVERMREQVQNVE